MKLTIEQINKALKSQGYVASLWHVEDVQEVRPDLTAEQSMEVLERCINKMDAEIGINWLLIETIADDLFPAPEEGE